MSRQFVKCPQCGWIHFIFEEMSQYAALSEDDKARLQRCFRCGAPSSTFIAAKHEDVPKLAMIRGVVVPDDSGNERWQRVIDELSGNEYRIPREQAEAEVRQQMKARAIWPKFFDDLAHACMCAKCVEADSDFHAEVAALVRDLSPAETKRAIEIIEADRETPDELKDMIEGYRLEARYDYLLTALRAARPQLVVIQGGKQ